jgi:predicted transcriptional regulator
MIINRDSFRKFCVAASMVSNGGTDTDAAEELDIPVSEVDEYLALTGESGNDTIKAMYEKAAWSLYSLRSSAVRTLGIWCGKSAEEIAYILSIDEATVKNYLDMWGDKAYEERLPEVQGIE